MWEDAWGTTLVATKDLWVSTYDGGHPSLIHVTHYDNDEDFFVGQNGMANSYNPGKWSRVDWVEDVNGTFHYCTSHYNAETEAEAMVAPASLDHSDYLGKGCGGWTMFSTMTPPPSAPLALTGMFADAHGYTIVVNNHVWVDRYMENDPDFVRITHYDNKEGFFVGQNGATNAWGATNWTRVDWVKDTNDHFWYCKTWYMGGSEAEVMQPAHEHDHALYATEGCNGFAFSQLMVLDPRMPEPTAAPTPHPTTTPTPVYEPVDPCDAICADSAAVSGRRLLFGVLPHGCKC
jgi:hypothetical protein